MGASDWEHTGSHHQGNAERPTGRPSAKQGMKDECCKRGAKRGKRELVVGVFTASEE